jgi:hypothetical protein
MSKEEELIDLNKLSARELLILVHSDVKELKEEMKTSNERQNATDIKVSNLETKNKVWAGVVGFFTALFTVLFERGMR